MADLQELLARLNGATASAGAGSQPAGHQQRSVSSPIFSPSPNGPQPQHASAIISPNMSAANTPGPEHGGGQQTPQQQSAQLLNLLRFNQQPSVSPQSIPPHLRRPSHNVQASENAGHGRQVSASDLAASFMTKSPSPAAQRAPASTASVPTVKSEQASMPAENPQDLLLRLLNQPKPAQTEAPRQPASAFTFAISPSVQAPETAVDDVIQDIADAKLEKVSSDPHTRGSTASPMRVFGSESTAQTSSFEPGPAAAAPKFTYVNPFDKLEAASPRNRTPAPAAKPATTKVEILKPKHALDGATGNDQASKTRKLESSLAAQQQETVAEAVSDLGQRVDQEVEEALANAEGKTETEVADEVGHLSHEVVEEVEEAICDMVSGEPSPPLLVVKTAAELLRLFDAKPAVMMQHIRLCILGSLSNVTLTEAELNGSTNGPNVAPLVDGWRTAFQHLPAGSQIKSIEFDMSCGEQAIQHREIVRLLQHISTLVYLKTKSSVLFSVVGCDDARKVWLEKSLVGFEVKKELGGEKDAEELEDMVGKPLADALTEAASEIAQADIADSWESAEAEDSPAKDEDQTVIVYQFPMRAFSSLNVENVPQRRPTFPPEQIMDIARLKKEFDQIDRSLVSATKNFIVYALVKKGGFRIIKQENGQYRQVFENHHERIFNVALCSRGDGSEDGLESILGIGVNGSVFWTSLEVSREDQFSDNLDSQGIVLPPSPIQDDNTSGGQLKTRAKPSSRHPEYFAVGRGKSIHIVFPKVAAEFVRGGKGVVQTEKYLKERSLRIHTGKAGKDFTFSEDDTVIVSLDKAGRMRFWDIRRLTESDLGVPRSGARPVEVSETLLEFHTTSPTAKSWPTSVYFFDKDKPFNKGIALRYVMVGMKQNHSFQLWDLGLGKAVQEINLPHEKESDAICSVAFHPRTGIMAVAHPTRNSIFFIHVSCPRYNLPPMNQASYIGRLAAKDKSTPLPPVNATAIMTSITEYSFASKGQIRSLHMLSEPAGPQNVDDPDSAALFELYIMHSKGVCTLGIRRSDLGWKKEGEPLHGRPAEEGGVITITQLKPPQPITDESSTGGDTPAPKSTSDRSVRESIKKESSISSRQSITPEAAIRASTLAKVESKQDAARAAIINGGDKSEKKKKKRATETASQASSVAPRAAPPSYAQAAQATPLSKSPVPPEPSVTVPGPSKLLDTEPPEWAKKIMSQVVQEQAPTVAAPAPVDPRKIAEIVQAEVTKGFSNELDALYKRLDEDKRVMNAQSGAKQEAILRLVSSTLTENVEGVIRKMVEENIRDVLLPKVLEQTTSTVEKSVSNHLKTILGGQLATQVPESVARALKSPQTLQSFSETIAKRLEPVVVAAAASVVNPATANLSSLIEHQIGDQIRSGNTQRLDDAAKIAQLSDTILSLNETVQSMAAGQAELQAQLVKLQQHLNEQSSQVATPQVSRSPAKPVQKTAQQIETEEITRLMADGLYEQGTMKWLQSNRTTELFDTVFVKCNPAYLSQVSPLLNLSTGAVVTDSLDHNLMERLIWLDAVLKNVDPQDLEIQDIVPKIMTVMNQRLTTAYLTLNENSPGNQLLRRISALVTRVNDLSKAVMAQSRLG